MNISIGKLNSKGKGKAIPSKPKPKPLDSEDEQEQDFFSSKLTSKPTKKPIPSTFVNSTPKLSREQRDTIQQAQALDASVYQYDELYDAMKTGQKKAEADRDQDAKERKPRYIEGLLQTAEQRKLDRVRAEDTMTAREREKEGGQFADKDAFVTPAFLAQQEELKAAEAAEREREAKERKSGLAGLYANYLDKNAAEHEAAMQAAAEHAANPTARPEPKYDEEPVADVVIAREAATRLNKLVELNEDGLIVDKTQLLSGGLNVGTKPKVRPVGPTLPPNGDEGGFSVPIAQRQAPASKTGVATGYVEEEHHSGLSLAQRRRLQRERQSKELEQQMLDSTATKRKAEEEELQKEVKKVARRNDETTVERLKREAAERRAKARAEAAAAAEVED